MKEKKNPLKKLRTRHMSMKVEENKHKSIKQREQLDGYLEEINEDELTELCKRNKKAIDDFDNYMTELDKKK